jgi:hypothetical protein
VCAYVWVHLCVCGTRHIRAELQARSPPLIRPLPPLFGGVRPQHLLQQRPVLHLSHVCDNSDSVSRSDSVRVSVRHSDSVRVRVRDGDSDGATGYDECGKRGKGSNEIRVRRLLSQFLRVLKQYKANKS